MAITGSPGWRKPWTSSAVWRHVCFTFSHADKPAPFGGHANLGGGLTHSGQRGGGHPAYLHDNLWTKFSQPHRTTWK